MRHLVTAFLFALALVALLLPAPASAQEAAGEWSGAIALPTGELGFSVVLTPGDDGWTGTIDIPAQQLDDFPLTEVRVEGAAAHFEMDGIPGRPTFDGKVDGDRLAGTITQSGQSLTFELTRGAQLVVEAPEVPAEPVTGTGAPGVWVGSIDTGAGTLRLVVTVMGGGEEPLTGKLRSVDQGALMEVEEIILEEGVLRLALPGIGATFEGPLSDDGSRVEGIWSQNGVELPLTLHRT